jgi:Flp pilus assembly protein CpaB
MMKVLTSAVLALTVLVITGGVLVHKLVTGEEPGITVPPPPESLKNRIVSQRELPSFTLIKGEDLELRLASSGLDKSTPNLQALTGRYLLTGVKRGAEVTDQMVAPREATPLLADAVAFSIPITSTTFPGGPLRPGDLVDAIAARRGATTEVKRFENVIVLSIVQPTKDSALPNAIILAIPRTRRDDLASAASAEWMLTRKIVVANQ